MVALAKPLLVGRAEHPTVSNFSLPNVSSTHVRQLLAVRGSAEVDQQLRELLPARVLDYVIEQSLYLA